MPQRTTLHCFHHAGGDRRAFRRWEGMCPGARVVAYDIGAGAGAGAGADEPIVETAHRWWTSSPNPSGVYYGHSMGALVAFEAAVAAQVLGGAGPRAVVLGAPPGAHARRRRDLGGPRPAPRLDRDLARVRRYEPSRVRLNAPIHVVRGVLDDVVADRDTLEWTARGGPGSRRIDLDGAGHLFHLVPDEALRALVADAVTGPAATSEATA